MKDLSSIIANMSPEKREQFLQKLKAKKNISSTSTKEVELIEEISENDNFNMAMTKPGNLGSFIRKKKPLIPPTKELIQVKIKAASLNFRDLMMALNLYPATPGLPSIMGSDYSGIVTAVGEDITTFKVGDEVICISGGSIFNNGDLDVDSHFSAYINTPKEQLTIKPKNITFEQAACLPTVFLTSYKSLIQIANLKKGERVLIHTGTGGVGQSAIQVAKWIGAEIFVTAGSDEKRQFLKDMGIKEPMNSRTLDFKEDILRQTNGEGVDVILNTLEGEACNAGLEILRNFGRFIQIDKKDIAFNNSLPLGQFNRGLSFTAFDLALYRDEYIQILLDQVSEHFAKGDFNPIPFVSYSIKELGSALTALSRAQHIGKIVLKY